MDSRFCRLEELTIVIPPHGRPADLPIRLHQNILLERYVDSVQLDFPLLVSGALFISPVIP